ncbi:MAG: NAD(P)/FAD-dependent oxidoreductase [Ignavibacteriales bacterium]|nr:NAD(P)/FAD-dependent oxidoreductase [Ignavibacteriales bacterium]MCB9209301.1 NAD(P)/FAD-dependent oxidoreductase [Ignavibacteriales bacterium]MCB9257945.1 NAD(P)/FAD-dependent oxidoreductase [Ignavibacteriales bacterium]
MKTEYDIIVVGAGPAGSLAAKFAAEQGVSVLMLEKDRDVGYPVRCGEAVSMAGLKEFIEPDPKWIATEITKFSFISPDKTKIEVEFEGKGCILERKIFDYELANIAAKVGTDILTRAYVNGIISENGKTAGVKFEYRGEQKEVKSKIVIAADGVESRVGRWAGLKTHSDFRAMESGIQITASNINVDQNTCYFYWGNIYAPQGYLWVFPKGNGLANIGLAITGDIGKKRSALSYLNEFMETHYPNASLLSQVAGGIPFTPTLEKIVAPGIMLVGDAARQINPLSGGGIISGMIGGSIAGKVAGEAIINDALDSIFTYEKKWHDRLGKRHEMFNRIKNGIYNLTDEKYNNIAHDLKKIPKNKITLGQIAKTAVVNKPSLLLDVAKTFF